MINYLEMFWAALIAPLGWLPPFCLMIAKSLGFLVALVLFVSIFTKLVGVVGNFLKGFISG